MLAMLVRADRSAGLLLLLVRLLLAWPPPAVPAAAAAAACANTGLMQTRVIRIVMGCSRQTPQKAQRSLHDSEANSQLMFQVETST
jgi:hypothetical protein